MGLDTLFKWVYLTIFLFFLNVLRHDSWFKSTFMFVIGVVLLVRHTWGVEDVPKPF